MPIYEYACTACQHRTDILHGRDDSGPQFCPSCGSEGTMRKTFAPPAIVFRGSGWAKKDRSSGARTKAAESAGDAAPAKTSTTDSGGAAASGGATSSSTGSSAGTSGPASSGGASTAGQGSSSSSGGSSASGSKPSD